jgi:hypothetical protein
MDIEYPPALSIHGTSFLEFLRDSYFDLARISIHWYCADNLDRDALVLFRIDGLDNFAKCSLPQETDGTIWKHQVS